MDQAFGDGAARAPSELLDQLRERLARLDPNHPSAVRREGEDHRRESQPEDADEIRPEHEDRPERQAQRAEGEPERHEDASGRDGVGPGQGEADEPGEAAAGRGEPSDWASEQLGPNSSPADVRISRLGSVSGDPYRPWFAPGDEGTPWFAG